MPGGEDFEAALGRYWKLSWRAASTPTLDKLREAEWRNMRNGDGSAWLGLTEDYLALGYTLEGARWMVEQAATKKSLPPPEWPPTLAEDFEQLFPAAAIAITDDSVLVADAVLFYGDGPAFETDFNNSKHVRRLEHLIGDPYEAEKPTTSTAIRQWAGPAKNEDERNRRNRWDLAQLIEHKIANGTITPVNETRNRHRELVPLGCLITLTDFVAAAREHGKGCNRFKAWLAQHEQELSGPVAEVDTAPDRGNPVAGDETPNATLPLVSAALPKAAGRRGRRPGSGTIDDNEPLSNMLRLLAEENAPPSINAAAAIVAANLPGTCTAYSAQRRLARKFVKKYGSEPPSGGTWADVLSSRLNAHEMHT